MSEPTPTTTAPTPNDLPTAAAAPTDSKPNDGDTPRMVPVQELVEARRARRAAETQAAELADKVKQFEDAQKSESERLTEQLTALKSEASTARAEALRLRVAAESGLPANLHEFLVGDDEEAVRAQAQKLMAATAAATDPRRPAPDPTQGAKQGAGDGQLTRADLAHMTPQEIVAAQESGRLADLMAGRI